MPILKNKPNFKTQNHLKEVENTVGNGNQIKRTRLNKHLQRVTRICDSISRMIMLKSLKNKVIIIFNFMTRQSNFIHTIICSINWMQAFNRHSDFLLLSSFKCVWMIFSKTRNYNDANQSALFQKK